MAGMLMDLQAYEEYMLSYPVLMDTMANISVAVDKRLKSFATVDTHDLMHSICLQDSLSVASGATETDI